MNLLEKLSAIDTVVLDVDGVLTDGSILLHSNGSFLRTMHMKDGYALQLAVKQGLRIIVITGSASNEVAARLRYLGITEYHEKIKDKKQHLQDLLGANANMDAVLFMGDDVPDLAAMLTVAIAACPADACADVLAIAHYISPIAGGKGCVRDVLEKILRLQNKWPLSKSDVASI
jgi:3-deoxy-D-manno-octulosonate 8-phosphate phosphatase (KDO 8-P phosphatase)